MSDLVITLLSIGLIAIGIVTYVISDSISFKLDNEGKDDLASNVRNIGIAISLSFVVIAAVLISKIIGI